MNKLILAIFLFTSPLLAQVQITKGVKVGGAGAGTGTVTNVSAATANGFAPTVSNPGSTPVITINVDSTHVLPINTGSASAYLTGAGSYSTPSFALFPGTSGIVYNTSTTASRNATYVDILSLWTGGSCTGTNVLQANGACGPGGGSISLTTNNNNGAASLASGTLNIPHYSGVAAPRTSGDCAEFDTNGIDLIDAGAACGSGGGSGTVTSFAAPSGSWPSWLVPTVTNSTTTPSVAVAASAIPNSALALQTANTVLGALTATTPSGLALPSCSATNDALIWTSGTGFGCQTISSGGSSITVNGGSALGSPVNIENSTDGTTTASNPSGNNVQISVATSTPSQLGASEPDNSTIKAAAGVYTAQATTINGTICTPGGSCAPESAPPNQITAIAAAVEDGGAAFASGLTRYDNNQPITGSTAPATDTGAYLSFDALAAQAQYAQANVVAPGYWLGTSIYLNFYSSVTTGNVEWLVQSACVAPNSVAGVNTWSTPFTVVTAVSTTANGSVVTALISNIAQPGVNGCPSTPTTPTPYKYRIYRLPLWAATVTYQTGDLVSLSGTTYVAVGASTNETPPNATYWTVVGTTADTAAGAANLTSVTQSVARSQ